jgi:arylsulfatase A-like enzyme
MKEINKMKKNLVIIMADQLRKDYLGCYGNTYVQTPNIDRLAACGVKFDNCFVNNPICMPNRLSIFTGQYPHNHGMWTNGLMLPHELPTIADYLGGNGYDTCNIGKMHFEPTDCGGSRPVVSREDHRGWAKTGDDIKWYGPYWGFSHVEFTIGHSTRPIAHYGKWFYDHGGTDDMAKAKKIEGFDYCPVTTMPAGLHDSSFIGERSAAYIKEHSGSEKPFFLVASFPDPHHPFNPPYDTAVKYKDTPIKIPVNETDTLETRPPHYKQHQLGIWHRAGILQITDNMTSEERARVEKNLERIKEFMDKDILAGLGLLTGGSSSAEKSGIKKVCEEERNQRIRNTYAMIDLIDCGIGKIIQALEETGKLENTVIVVTADHGELMGDHGLWLKGPFFYDGLVKIPLVIRTPELSVRARTSQGSPPDNKNKSVATPALASSIDLFPTCCELLGLEIPLLCDGVSLVSAFDGGKPRNECLIEYRNGYFESDINTMAYIDEDYKFVQYQNGDCELTDRQNDKEENVNIAFDNKNMFLVNEYRRKILMEILRTGNKAPYQISHA